MKKRLVIIWKAFLCLIAAWGLTGCLAGVPNYEGQSKKYLQAHGYSKEVVDALLNYKPLDPDMVAQLSRVPNMNVRVMLAQNPHLTFAERQVLWQDKEKYVRRSLASNLRLSHEEMTMILQEPIHTFGARQFLKVFPYASSSRNEYPTVLEGLAENPAAPREILLQVFEKRRAYGSESYFCFAVNPNCPQEIIDAIIERSDGKTPSYDMELHWLQITQKRKEEHRQLKAQGKPFPSHAYPKWYNWRFADLWWRDE